MVLLDSTTNDLKKTPHFSTELFGRLAWVLRVSGLLSGGRVLNAPPARAPIFQRHSIVVNGPSETQTSKKVL